MTAIDALRDFGLTEIALRDLVASGLLQQFEHSGIRFFRRRDLVEIREDAEARKGPKR